MLEITNAERAGLALDAVTCFAEETGVDTATAAIGDLIANLLHLARGRGLDVDTIVKNSAAMMRTEVLEDEEGDMVRVQTAFRKLFTDDD